MKGRNLLEAMERAKKKLKRQLPQTHIIFEGFHIAHMPIRALDSFVV
ncbi:MAG: hypothetical protein LBU32_10445 [Clostridiales bacterium]|jgi:hypothetical protein|nr:hypothetical protein [Clostridiales bacterium]